jgi:ADP-heptose:LPS heptosyltransferase
MKKILLIQTAFLGDVILATATLEQLRAAFPDARIDMLVRKGNEGVLAGHPFLGKTWIWDKGKGKYGNLLRLIAAFRRERYDLAVNLQRFFSTGLLTALSGARYRTGFAKNPLSFAFTYRFAHQVGGVHEVARNGALLSPWVADTPARPRLYPRLADYATAPETGSYICIAPTSVWYTKQWPAEQWVELIKLLPKDLKIVLLGGKADRDACEHIRSASSHPAVANKAGELSLLESAAWMAGARMNYVNDSAPLHIASAMNAPVTAVFCSTVPAFGFGPLSDQSRVVETPLSLDCRPCGLHGKRACPEGHFRCAEIAPDLVKG